MRKQVQSCLTAEGFNPGPSDGMFGPRTRGAIRVWQAARGQDRRQAAGYLTENDYAALLADCRVAERPQSDPGRQSRQQARESERGPETVSTARREVPFSAR